MAVDQWPEFRIGDLGEVFTGRTPSTERKSYFGDEFPFITPGDMRWDPLESTCRHASLSIL